MYYYSFGYILGLGYMFIEGVYIDVFIFYEKFEYDFQFLLFDVGDDNSFFYGQDIVDFRKVLYDTWLKYFRYQLLWKIRNYFGEKIVLYFVWFGEFMMQFLQFLSLQYCCC